MILALLAIVTTSTSARDLGVISSRIINGDAVKKGSFEGVVAITYAGNTICSGSLVTQTQILTAAHCILPVEVPGQFLDFTSEAGVYIGHGVEGGVLPSQYKIKSYYVHPQYRKHPFGKNDLAIIELDSEIKNIQPIEILEAADVFKKYIKIQSDIVVMGFGYRQNTINEFPTEVKNRIGRKYQTRMSIVKQNSNEIYLEANETGPCTGDSGGPAFINIDNEAYLVGIASRVTGKCGHISTGAFYGLIADSSCWLATHGIKLSSFNQVCDKENTFLIKEALNRVTGDVDKLSVKELDLSNQYINSLVGVSAYKNLEILNIENNKVTNLKELKMLTKLRKLYIAGNDIQIEDLDKYQTIVVGENKQQHNYFKTDFFNACESLSTTSNDNKSIVNEVLSFTRSKDCFSAHIALQELSSLDLSGLGLSSIDVLKDYNKFSLLYLDDNNLENIKVVESMSELETLYFSRNKVSDLSPLLKLNKLQYVDASYNDISSLVELRDLEYFLMINLSGNDFLDSKACFENSKLRCL
jgi:V8-like Glu-specific endopeptidase